MSDPEQNSENSYGTDPHVLLSFSMRSFLDSQRPRKPSRRVLFATA